MFLSPKVPIFSKLLHKLLMLIWMLEVSYVEQTVDNSNAPLLHTHTLHEGKMTTGKDGTHFSNFRTLWRFHAYAKGKEQNIID